MLDVLLCTEVVVGKSCENEHFHLGSDVNSGPRGEHFLKYQLKKAELNDFNVLGPWF